MDEGIKTGGKKCRNLIGMRTLQRMKNKIVYGVNIVTGIQVSDCIECDSDRAVVHKIAVLTPWTSKKKCIFSFFE